MTRLRGEFLERFVEVAVEVDSGGLANDDQWRLVNTAIVPERRCPIGATVDTSPCLPLLVAALSCTLCNARP